MSKTLKIFRTIVLALCPSLVLAQSVPNGMITYGEEWTAAQWNAAWAAKLDYPFNPAAASLSPSVLAPGTLPSNIGVPSASVLPGQLQSGVTLPNGSVSPSSLATQNPNTVLSNCGSSNASPTAVNGVIGTAINITCPTYGASTSASSSANATAIQAAINAAIAAHVPLYIPAAGSSCYSYTAPLTINGNITIVGDYVSGNWAGTNEIDQPSGTPPLLGSVLCPSTNGSDAIDITGNGVTVNITNLGLSFQTAFGSTGDGIHYVPTTTQGLSGSVWNNVLVYGHSGNKYAFNLANPIYNTFTQTQSYGGGGYNLYGGGVATSNFGNTLFLNSYTNVCAAGSAYGIKIASQSSSANINLLTFVRPQVNINNSGCPGTTPPTSAQLIFSQDVNTTAVTMTAADLETNVGSPMTLNLSPAGNNNYGLASMFTDASAINSPYYGNSSPSFSNTGPFSFNDTTSNGSVAGPIAGFIAPTLNLTASSPVTYAVAATIYCGAGPISGTNVTITRGDCLYANGEIYTTADISAGGGMYITGGGSWSGSDVQLNVNNGSGTTEIGSGTTTGQVTIGGASNVVSIPNLTVTGTATIPKSQSTILQSSLPFIYGPSGYLTATGTYIIGQAPSSSATASFSATSGTGVTMTMSAATLLGTASDVGRVLTILDTTYKYATITAFSSTTVATVTITGTLSSTGAFANNTIWLSGTTQSLGNTVSFGSPLSFTYPSAYLYVPASSAIGTAEWVYGTCASTTVCTLYNNVYSSGTPTIPVSPVAFSGLTPSAFTQTVSSFITGPAVTLAGNSLGLEGSLEFDVMQNIQNSANNKIARCLYAGGNVGQNSATSGISDLLRCRMRNAGAANVQTSIYENTGTSSGVTIATPIHSTVNSATSQTVGIALQDVGAYDWNVIESYSVVVKPF